MIPWILTISIMRVNLFQVQLVNLMKHKMLFTKEGLIQVMTKILMTTKEMTDRRNIMTKWKKKVEFMEKASLFHRRLRKMEDKKHLTNPNNLKPIHKFRLRFHSLWHHPSNFDSMTFRNVHDMSSDLFYGFSNDACKDQRDESIKLGKRSPQFGGT